MKTILRKIKRRIFRQLPIPITTTPHHKTIRGRTLVSYIAASILKKDSSSFFDGHTHCWESKEIVKVFNKLGYIVDTIDYSNNWFLPQIKYNVVFDIYTNLQRIAPFIDQNTVKILHLTGSHPRYQNQAEINRIRNFEQRTKKLYTPKRLVPNVELAERSLKLADFCTLLGNAHTLRTYPSQYHNKIFLIPVTASRLSYKKKENYVPKKREFLWFFGSGAIHKGLDLLIDIFAQHKNLILNIVGNIQYEKDFFNAYGKKINNSQNIRLHGSLAPSSNSFINILKDTFCFIAPSCSEGTSPACATCLQAGLFPIVSRDTGVTLPEGAGIYLDTCSHQEITDAIFKIHSMDTKLLTKQIIECQKQAIMLYSRQNFTEKLTENLQQFLHPQSCKAEKII
ncbi:glycosyltransferase [Candidatus Dependentiae bacterium]|nr:glycosyltransferase [Candidatus Dependentiae bacterium]